MRKLIALLCLIATTSFAQDYVLTDGTNLLWGAGLVDLSPSLSMTRTNFYAVKSLSDLTNYAFAVTNEEIYLAADSVYEINGSIPLGTNKIMMGSSSVLSGRDKSSDQIVYTGTNYAVTIDSVDASINTLLFATPSGKALSISGGAFKQSEIKECLFVNCLGVLDQGEYNRIVFRNNLMFDINGNVLSFDTGGHELHIVNNIFETFSDGAFTNMDFATSVWAMVNINGNYCDISTNAYFFAGVTNNGNLTTSGLGNVVGNMVLRRTGFTDHTNYTYGIHHSDIQWNWQANAGLDDSVVEGAMVFTNTPYTVPITTVSVSVSITDGVSAGWKSSDDSERIVLNTNRLSYTGLRSAEVLINATCGLQPDKNNKRIYAVLTKNGTDIPETKVELGVMSLGARGTFTMTWLVKMNTDDYIQVAVGNDTDAQDVIVNSCMVSLAE